MSDQTGWILRGPGRYEFGQGPHEIFVELRTSRWGATSALSELYDALRSARPQNKKEPHAVAEYLITYCSAELGITNTDRPIVIVNFHNQQVLLWSDREKCLLEETSIERFVDDQNLRNTWTKLHFAD